MVKIEQPNSLKELSNDKHVGVPLNYYMILGGTLTNRKLPRNTDIKIGKKSIVIKTGDTQFKVDCFGGDAGYSFINLSTNKQYFIKKGEEKILGREGEILVNETDIKSSRKHLKVRVDEEGNLFLCDISKYGTLINPVESNEKKKSTIKCEKMTTEEINQFKKLKKSEHAKLFYDGDEKV